MGSEDRTSLDADEFARIAPNVDWWIMRPTRATPPVYTYRDVLEWVTLDDVLRAHEILNVELALDDKDRSNRGDR